MRGPAEDVVRAVLANEPWMTKGMDKTEVEELVEFLVKGV